MIKGAPRRSIHYRQTKWSPKAQKPEKHIMDFIPTQKAQYLGYIATYCIVAMLPMKTRQDLWISFAMNKCFEIIDDIVNALKICVLLFFSSFFDLMLQI